VVIKDIMKTKIYKIYKLTNIINGMIYIGYTQKKLITRIRRHVITNSYIGNALRNYEIKNFKVEVLWETKNKKDACIVEKAAICAYRTQFPNGYNLTSGGENPPNHKGEKQSKEHIINRSEALKGRIGPMQGKHHSKETIEKMKVARAKRPCSDFIGKNNPMYGRKRPDVVERNKENRYAKGKKQSKVHILKKTISRLETISARLEDEIIKSCIWDGT